MSISRRDFLQRTAAGSALVGISVGAPGCGNEVTAAPLADATVDDSIVSPTYGQVHIDVGRYPQLDRVGGAITLKLQSSLNPNDQNRSYALPPDNTILVVQVSSGSFVALQSSCPHAGCPLGFSTHDLEVECPCHSSRFRITADPANKQSCVGAVTHAPAKVGLQSWQTTYDAGTKGLTIDLKLPVACNNTFPPVVAGTITLSLTDFPQLAMTGGAATGQPTGVPDPIIVIRVDATTVVALDAKCTHRGCTVNYDAKPNDVVCPCHGSVFGLDGSVKIGPADIPLKSYTATLTGNSVVIAIG